MKNGDGNEVTTAIRDVFAKQSSVLVGYLFGSVCTGRRGPLSDIDVAVLLRESPSRAAQEGDIHDALCRALRTDRVDFVSLSSAPPSLSYRIIRDGECVYCADERARENFETSTVMRYLDFKPVREQALRTSRATNEGER